MAEHRTREAPRLTEEDFYLDELGRMVFTRAYHLKRGTCCESGCRHCPWDFRRTAPASTGRRDGNDRPPEPGPS